MAPDAKNSRYVKKRTTKLIDRLSYSPAKHKQKDKKSLRKMLQSQKPPDQSIREPSTKIKIGSINLNGLDLETGWAVEQIITNYELDASIILVQILKIKIIS